MARPEEPGAQEAEDEPGRREGVRNGTGQLGGLLGLVGVLVLEVEAEHWGFRHREVLPRR